MSVPPDDLTSLPAEESAADTTMPSHSPDTGTEEGSRDPNQFELRTELARGGMGVVYTAFDNGFGREVAIKVLLPEWQDLPEALSRFVSEARITGRLQHPGVPPAHHLGVLPDGRPFLAMKLVRGRTLAELLKERSSPTVDLPRFLQAFEQICQAVGYAHSEGIVHRDIKPQNVMVGAFGEVQVMDWGLAKEMQKPECGTPADEGQSAENTSRHIAIRRLAGEARLSPDSDLTRAGSVIGTPMYMPPEQARGERERIGPWSDVFSLGGVLCLILTGRPPYSGSRNQVLTLAELGSVEEAFTRLEASAADPELIALCKLCLQRETTKRPADGKAVADAVAAYRTGVEARLRTAESAKAAAEARAVEEANTRREAEARAREQRKKRRWQLTTVSIAAALVLAAGAFAWWLDRAARDRREEQTRIESERAAAELRQEAESLRREQIERERLGRNRLGIETLLAQADTELRLDNTRAATSLLTQADKRFLEGGAEELRPRWQQRQRDLMMLRELDRLDTLRWTAIRGRFQTEEADRQLPAVFGRYGINPKTMTATEIVERIEASPLRERLIGSLDRWLFREQSAEILVILQAVDPDPFRNEVRLAVAVLDTARLPALAERAEARVQPPRFAILLGELPELSFRIRQDILLDTHFHQPSDLPLLMALGRLYPIETKVGAPNRVGWYRAALAVRPDHTAAWNGLGIALRDIGEPLTAAEAFRQAIHFDPTSMPARNNLGTVLADLGKVDDAIAVFREVARLDPNDLTTWFNLGTAYLKKGDKPAAVDAFQEALRIDPTDSKTHFNLGFTLDELEDIERAIESYRAAISFDPNYAAARFNLAILLAGRKDYPAAIAEYRETIRLLPMDARAHYNLGNALFLSGDGEGAIVEYRNTIACEPTHADAFCNLGVALEKQGLRTEAITAYREAARLNPTKYDYLLPLMPQIAPPPREVKRP